MEPKPIALSVLMTREEYMQLTVQIHRLRSGGPSFFTLAGGILGILSLAGIFFGHYISLSPFTAGCLLVFGVFLMIYEGIIAPILDKGAAAREYEEKEELRTANVYEFGPGFIKIRNSRMEGKLPLSLVTSWAKTAGGLSVSYGRECHVLIPTRLLDEGQWSAIQEWLAAAPVSGHA